MKIVARLEQDCAGNWRPVLFFPETLKGNYLESYTQEEGHSMAHVDYYRTCTKRGDYQAVQLARKYAAMCPDKVRILKQFKTV